MVYRFLIRKKYVDMFKLILLGEDRIRELSKKVNLTYIHTREVLKYYQDKDLIKKVFDGDNDGKRDYSIRPTYKTKVIVVVFNFLSKIDDTKSKKEINEQIDEMTKHLNNLKITN